MLGVPLEYHRIRYVRVQGEKLGDVIGGCRLEVTFTEHLSVVFSLFSGASECVGYRLHVSFFVSLFCHRLL